MPAAFFERLIAESMKLPAPLWRATIESLLRYDDAGELSRIPVPALLIWGEHDALFSRNDQDRLLAAIPGSRLEVYAGTGHCPNWERLERVAAHIMTSLQEA